MKWYLMGFDMGSVANDSEHLTVNGHVSILFEEMSFQMSQLFTSGGQRIGVSASASVLPMKIQD